MPEDIRKKKTEKTPRAKSLTKAIHDGVIGRGARQSPKAQITPKQLEARRKTIRSAKSLQDVPRQGELIRSIPGNLPAGRHLEADIRTSGDPIDDMDRDQTRRLDQLLSGD